MQCGLTAIAPADGCEKFVFSDEVDVAKFGNGACAEFSVDML